MKQILLPFLFFIIIPSSIFAQVDESKTGSWYMYFWNVNFKESPFGLQGDVQYRNWNTIGDLEQLLLRVGFTYAPPKTNIKFVLGFANITSGAYGDSDAKTQENRIYQQALLSQKIGERIYINHRFRYEQRFVEGQDFRTRYRYNLFLTVPLNKKTLDKGAFYVTMYNEIFLNGQKDIGNNIDVEIFDTNRLYTGFGYTFSNKLRMQLGFMKQTKNNLSKNQIQVSIHHKL